MLEGSNAKTEALGAPPLPSPTYLVHEVGMRKVLDSWWWEGVLVRNPLAPAAAER